MGDDAPPLRLEEIIGKVDCPLVKSSIINAVFSTTPNERDIQVNYLKFRFGGSLRRCYIDGDYVFLDINDNGHKSTVVVCKIPRKYMDVGYYSFEIN